MYKPNISIQHVSTSVRERRIQIFKPGLGLPRGYFRYKLHLKIDNSSLIILSYSKSKTLKTNKQYIFSIHHNCSCLSFEQRFSGKRKIYATYWAQFMHKTKTTVHFLNKTVSMLRHVGTVIWTD